jgi:hypothetical protein
VENALAAGRVKANPVIALAAIGLTPISPMILVDPVVEIPVLERITKLPADPRFTASGLAASAAIGTIRPSTQVTATATETMFIFFMLFILNINFPFVAVLAYRSLHALKYYLTRDRSELPSLLPPPSPNLEHQIYYPNRNNILDK